MNYFDIIVIIPLLWSLYKGFRKGLIIEMASLIALALGIWGGMNLSGYVAGWISGSFEVSYKLLPLLSFAITFITIVIAVFALAKLLEKVIKLVALGLVNRIFGALFGFLKIVLICSVVIYMVETVDRRFPFLPKNLHEESVLYGPISSIAPALMPFISGLRNENVSQ